MAYVGVIGEGLAPYVNDHAAVALRLYRLEPPQTEEDYESERMDHEEHMQGIWRKFWIEEVP